MSVFVPKSISYAGGRVSIDFNYEAKTDPSLRFIGGAHLQNQNRIVSITSRVGGIATREYRMGYGSSSVVSRLETITECDPRSGICFNPTRFAWKEAPAATTTSGAEHYVHSSNETATRDISRIGFGDFNGDGRTDVYRIDSSYNTLPISIYSYRADGGQDYSQGPSVYVADSTKQVLKDLNRVKTGDFNGDGLTDFMHVGGSDSSVPVTIWLKTSTGFSSPISGPTHYVSATGEFGRADVARIRVVDLNGDGMSDLHILHKKKTSIPQSDTPSTIYYSQGGGSFGSAQTGPTIKIGGAYPEDDSSLDDAEAFQFDVARVRYGDFNGDGLQDIYIFEGCSGDTPSSIWFNSRDGFTRKVSTNYNHYTNCDNIEGRTADLGRGIQGDFNADGMTDFLVVTSWNGSTASDLIYSTGDGNFHKQQTLSFYVGNTPSALSCATSRIKVADLNSDGFSDILHLGGAGSTKMFINRGSGTFQEIALPNYPVSSNSDTCAVDTLAAPLSDVNGDGIQEMYVLPGRGSTQTTQLRHLPLTAAERVSKITNGLGAATEITYSPITSPAVHTRATTSTYPNIAVQSSMHVVSAVSNANGLCQACTRRVEHSYSGALVNLDGRGFLGFASHTTFDTASKVREVTNFRQDFPYLGLPSSVTTKTDTGVLISEESTNYASRNITVNGSTRHFPYAASRTKKDYEITSPGTVARTEVTTSTYGEIDSAFFGNLTASTTRISKGADGADISPFIVATSNIYTNDASKWLLGRLTRATVTKSGNARAAITRISGFEYDALTGLLMAEIIEPTSTTLRLRKSFLRDSVGNIYSTTVSGPDFTSRTSTIQFDSAKQFPVSTTNALNQISYLEHDAATGNVTSVTDSNGLTISSDYDGLGRKIRDRRPDGTTTTWTRAWGTGLYPVPNGVFTVTTASSDGASASVVSDFLERPISTFKFGALGNHSRTLTVFDGAGRVSTQSVPFSGYSNYCFETWTYDGLGRPKTRSSPHNSNDCAGRVTNYSYGVRTSSTTDPMGRTSSQEVDALGLVTKTTDAKGFETSFLYDAYGNQTQVLQGSKPATVIDYDIRGRKTRMVDPDMGTWRYQYNALGELKQQTNAKSQVTTFDYDLLGRMTVRSEQEGISYWWYDNDTLGQRCWNGALCESLNSNGRAHKQFKYDSLGRVASETTTAVGKEIPPKTPQSPTPGDTTPPGPTTASLDVTFNWLPSVGATSYSIKIYQSSTSTLAWEATVPGTSYALSMPANVRYYWTVNACNSGGCSNETAARHFKTNPTPRPPTGLTPGYATAPGPTTGNSSVAFRWSPSGGATRYMVEVRRANGVMAYSTQTTATTVSATLAPNSNYYWNAFACSDEACSSASQTAYFRTPAPAQPQPPTNLSPGSSTSPGPFTESPTVTFRWSDQYADYYEVQLRDHQNKVLSVNRTTPPTFTTDLRPLSRYAWSVRSCYATTCSNWTSLLYFQASPVNTCLALPTSNLCLNETINQITNVVYSTSPVPVPDPVCPLPDMACVNQLLDAPLQPVSPCAAPDLDCHQEQLANSNIPDPPRLRELLDPILSRPLDPVTPCTASDFACLESWVASNTPPVGGVPLQGLFPLCTASGCISEIPSSSSHSSMAAASSSSGETNAPIASGARFSTITRFEYDAQSRISKAKYGDHIAVGYGYDSWGHLETITNGANENLWRTVGVDARNNVTTYRQSSNLVSERIRDLGTGELKTIRTNYAYDSQIVQSMGFLRDKMGQITQKSDSLDNRRNESFAYDELYRLKSNTVNSAVQDSVEYNEYGNITYRRSTGRYAYSATRPHAVASITEGAATGPAEYQLGQPFVYDANGNLTSAGGRSYTWTSYDKPSSINLGAEKSNFEYDADRVRVYELQDRSVGTARNITQIITAGAYERRISESGAVEDRVYIVAAGLPVALLIRAGVETAPPDGGTGATIRYLHADHQGSVEVISGFINGVFSIIDRMSYDPFGGRRLPTAALDPTHSEQKRLHSSERGYTAHHHLDHLQLIHMNGRVYDPALGRFVSADPFVQNPYNSQSLNRYSYVWNNPVNSTDPSGYWSVWESARNISHWTQANQRVVYASAIAIVGSAGLGALTLTTTQLVAGSAAVGFASGYVASGGDLKAAAVSAVTAGAFAGVGNYYSANPNGLVAGSSTGALIEKTIAHGMVGGVSSRLQGGSFGSGFLSAAVPASYRNAGFGAETGSALGYVEAAILGGTGSEFGGGKFANGAVTATMAYAFNDALHYEGSSKLVNAAHNLKNAVLRTFGAEDTLVIGEGMTGRVIPYADAIGADYYAGLGRKGTPAEYMNDNIKFINEQMSRGVTIVDVGPSPTNPKFPNITSDYYYAEIIHIATFNQIGGFPVPYQNYRADQSSFDHWSQSR